MAYVRNKDIGKAGKGSIEKDMGVLLTKIKHGHNKRVQKRVPTFNHRGRVITKPDRWVELGVVHRKRRLKKVM